MVASLCLLILGILSTWLVRDHLLAIRRNGTRLARPPGTLPFAGYGLWFLRPRHELLDWLASIQGSMKFETYELPVPSLPPAVLINDPGLLREVLKDIRVFVKGTFFRSRSSDLFRDGILNADGATWRVQRKAGLRFLSVSNVEYFIDVVLPPLLDDMIDQLRDAAQAGRVIDLQEELLSLTTRFMGRIAYDMDITNDMPFSRAFEYASAEVGYRFTNPLWRLKDYIAGARMRKAVREIHSFGASIVESTTSGSGKFQPHVTEGPGFNAINEIPRANLIQSLLGHLASPDTVAAAAMNYLSAGRDTTAQSMAWTFYHLIRNPSVMHRLQSYIRTNGVEKAAFRYRNVGSDHQPYMHAVFAESLRLSPPIPLEIKETTQAICLSDGTSLPEGAVVIWSPYAMARNPLIWGRDAATFRPERWLNGVKARASHEIQHGREGSYSDELDIIGASFVSSLKSPFEHTVFNAGPRACIGKHLAEILAASVVPRIVSEFDVTVDCRDGQSAWHKVGGDGLTMSVKGGLLVKLSFDRRNVFNSTQ